MWIVNTPSTSHNKLPSFFMSGTMTRAITGFSTDFISWFVADSFAIGITFSISFFISSSRTSAISNRVAFFVATRVAGRMYCHCFSVHSLEHVDCNWSWPRFLKIEIKISSKKDYWLGDSMIWDFPGRQALSVSDYVVSIEGSLMLWNHVSKIWRLLVRRKWTDEKLDVKT